MENCFKLIKFIFIIFLDFERIVSYLFLIEMTQLQLYLFCGQNGTSLCNFSFTYWCYWLHLMYGKNINISKNTFLLNTPILVYFKMNQQ